MFADWLSAELVQRGMSQADLEDKSGLSAATISRILNGSRGAGRETAEKIARAFNMPPENVLKIAGLLPVSYQEVIDSEPSLRELFGVVRGMTDRQKRRLIKYALFLRDDDTLADNVTRKIDEIKARVSALATERESLTGTATDAEYQRIALDALDAQLVKIRRLLKQPSTEIKRKIVEAVETRVVVLTDEMGRRWADVETLLGDARLPLVKPTTGRPRNG